ncbi:MAG: tRNA 2-thiouridine(34) synthase MnmA [Bacteroidetes bacterium]|nr:tRNA 2-thiouridine(34) synthase MnmA [Bacteroidota bacterium]
MKRVVVGLSGGVDSSVAAYLLQKEGYEVIGIFMRNWHDESVTLTDDCPWIDDANDALLVAQHLGIPFQVIDLSVEYKERIVDYMFHEYKIGRTPNPDVLCNREIKFDVFLNAALQLGADYVATGHYCRKRINTDGSSSLLSGLDKNKDQSYFLCQVSQNQLAKALFPIGDIEKSEVRRIATEQGLLTAEKKDSQGLCFVGKISLPDFLQQQLKSKNGKVIEIPADLPQLTEYHSLDRKTENIEKLVEPFVFNSNQGKMVATHQGAHFFTVGQRKGLQIGGRPLPSFAIQIDTENNLVYSCQGDDHPALNRWALKIELNAINWIQFPDWAQKQEFEVEIDARIRYRQPLQKAKLIKKNFQFYMLFNKLQRGITPGQFAAWYIGEELIGSGVIES